MDNNYGVGFIVMKIYRMIIRKNLIVLKHHSKNKGMAVWYGNFYYKLFQKPCFNFNKEYEWRQIMHKTKEEGALFYLTEIKEKGDADNTKPARKFYYEFWKDLYSTESSNSVNSKEQKFDLRGDTIISFATMAGCIIRLLAFDDIKKGMPKSNKDRLDIIMNSERISDQMKHNFKYFYKIYHSLANFMPLVQTKKNTNLNSIKGDATGRYHDFPDLFFEDIRNYYIGSKFKSDKFACAVSSCECNAYTNDRKKNLKYLDYFGNGLEGWKQFVEKNYLQCFFEDKEYSIFKKLVPNKDLSSFPYRKKRSCLSQEKTKECLNEIDIFLVNAITIIEKRATLLVNTMELNNFV